MSRLIYGKMMNYSVNRASKNCYPYGKKTESLSQTIYRQTSFYPAFQILHFFLNLKVCGNLASSKAMGDIFFLSFFFYTSICLFHVSVSHFGNSHNFSNFVIFIILFFCYCYLWGVIFDVAILIVFQLQKLCLYNTLNLINIVCLWQLHWSASAPFLSLFSVSLP